MIISHKHRFIFIKTEKTAGTSIEIALSKICGDEDIITPISLDDEIMRKQISGRGAQNYKVPFSKYSFQDWVRYILYQQQPQFYNHISLSEVKGLVSQEIWDNYYRFTFERNPFDKLISWYYWKGGNERFSSIFKFLMSGYAGNIRGFDIYSRGGMPRMNFIGRYENMEEDLKTISHELNLPEAIALPTYVAKGGIRKDKKHYSEILTEEEKALAIKMFSREMSFLGYKY